MTIWANGLAMALAALSLATPASAEPSKARRATVSAGAGGLAGLFSADDYPSDAARDWAQGRSEVEITITPTGRVGKCVVVVSSGTASLDKRTCDVLTERARYTPARDAGGQPTSDTERHSIMWALPPDHVEDDYLAAVVAIDRGAAGACRNEPVRAKLRGCDLAQGIAKFVLTTKNIPSAREMVVEYGDRIGTARELASIGTGPGMHRDMLIAVTTTIAPDGSISDCRPTAGLKDNQARANDCPRSSGRKFVPQPPGVSALRYLTNYKLVYLRGLSPAPRIINFSSLFGPDDYPADALSQSREGRVDVEVTVGADGRASGCIVKVSSGTPSLDAVTCAKLLSAGKYEAARDPQQRVVRSTMVKSVNWALPRAPFDDRSTRLVMALPNGQSCVVEGSPSDDIDCNGARDFVAMARTSPDAKGKSALVAEFGQVVGSGESLGRISEGPGKSSWYASAVTLMIDATGKLVACKPSFDWVGADDAKEQCDAARLDIFLPLDASIVNRQPRALTRYEAIYFRD